MAIIILIILVVFIIPICNYKKELDAQETRRWIQKEFGNKSNLTYYDGQNKQRYVNDNSLYKGGRFSNDPKERARHRQFTPPSMPDNNNKK